MTSCGKSLVEAIEDKYRMEETELDIQIFGLPKNKSEEPNDVVVPSHLVVDDAGVTHAGDLGRLSKLCGNVCELDLEINLLSDWEKVFEILNQVPKCSLLNLRMNPLPDFQPEDDNNIPEFTNIIKLVLNHTPITLQSICSLLQVFPSLRELYASLNNYGAVEVDTSQIFPKLQSLHFRSNNISNWTEIAKLGKLFPNLTHLVLLDNPMEHFPDSVEEMSANFQKLKNINVSETRISKWSELEKFRYFPELTELRVQDIPLLKEYTEEQRRSFLLAYLPNIKRLNGASVPDGEKEDAERAFIRYYMEMAESERPTRYDELETKHGKLAPLVEIDLSGKNEITLEVRFLNEKSRLLKVNIHMTCFELKKLLTNELKSNLSEYSLHYLRNGWPHAREMVSPNRTLLNLRMDDMDTIIIKEREMKYRFKSACLPLE